MTSELESALSFYRKFSKSIKSYDLVMTSTLWMMSDHLFTENFQNLSNHMIWYVSNTLDDVRSYEPIQLQLVKTVVDVTDCTVQPASSCLIEVVCSSADSIFW